MAKRRKHRSGWMDYADRVLSEAKRKPPKPCDCYWCVRGSPSLCVKASV